MEVLSSRILVRPGDPGRSRRFYRDVLGPAIYREFGCAATRGQPRRRRGDGTRAAQGRH